MAMAAFDQRLMELIRTLPPSEKKLLNSGGAGIFNVLRQVRLEEPFLDACLELWEPDYHVFRFPSGEVCPLVEEFGAIGGWNNRPLPVVLRLELGYRAKFRDFLSLTQAEVEHVFVGDRVSMIRLVDKFLNRNDATISPAARRRAISYCLLQRYGFTELMSANTLGHPRLLCMVEQMELGKNPAHIILGETILGLDDRKASRTRSYGGCPRILQVWLMERLGVLANIDSSVSYNPHGIVSRPMSWLVARYRPEGYFRDYVQSRPIRWVIPWWGIREYVATSVLDASSGLMLCGFRWGVWVHPLRVRRQIGLLQKIPKEDTRVQANVMLTDEVVNDWEMRWLNRVRWHVPLRREPTKVSRAYQLWTVSKDGRENERLRIEEEAGLPKETQPLGSKAAGPSKVVSSKGGAGPSKVVTSKGEAGPSKVPPIVKSVVVGPSKGIPSSGGVCDRLGEAGSSKVVEKPKGHGVFERLGPRDGVFDRLGDGKRVVVCALRAKSKRILKVGPSKPRNVEKPLVIDDASKERSDEENGDRNPKRVRKE